MSCPYQRKGNSPKTYHCTIGRFGHSPSKSTCEVCMSRGLNHPRGAGDQIARVAEPVKKAIQKVAPNAFKGCGCKKRQELLNKLLPNKNEDNNDG